MILRMFSNRGRSERRAMDRGQPKGTGSCDGEGGGLGVQKQEQVR